MLIVIGEHITWGPWLAGLCSVITSSVSHNFTHIPYIEGSHLVSCLNEQSLLKQECTFMHIVSQVTCQRKMCNFTIHGWSTIISVLNLTLQMVLIDSHTYFLNNRMVLSSLNERFFN